jgi:hypothetical protein
MTKEKRGSAQKPRTLHQPKAALSDTKAGPPPMQPRERLSLRKYLIGCAIQGAAFEREMSTGDIVKRAITIADAVIQERRRQAIPPTERALRMLRTAHAQKGAERLIRRHEAAADLLRSILDIAKRAGYSVHNAIQDEPPIIGDIVISSNENGISLHYKKGSRRQNDPIACPELVYDPEKNKFVSAHDSLAALEVVARSLIAADPE